MSHAFHITVAAVIEQDGHYLMVREQDAGVCVINQPAGHLEPGESLAQAVVREVLEETAHPFTPTGLIGVYQWVAPNGHTYMRFAFCGEIGEPHPEQQLDPDIEEALWLTETALSTHPCQPRSPLVMQCIKDAHLRKPLPLDVLHDMR